MITGCRTDPKLLDYPWLRDLEFVRAGPHPKSETNFRLGRHELDLSLLEGSVVEVSSTASICSPGDIASYTQSIREFVGKKTERVKREEGWGGDECVREQLLRRN